MRDNLALGGFARRDKAGAAKTLEEMYALFPRLKEQGKPDRGDAFGG